MNAETSTFVISCKNTDVGLCDFTVEVDGGKWSCQASWLKSHPGCDLIIAAVDAHQFYYGESYRSECADSTVCAEDDPGGIRIDFIFKKDHRIDIKIGQYTDGTLKLEPDEIIRHPYYEGEITLDQLIMAAYKCGADLLRENGITGLHVGWCGWHWGSESRTSVFPLAQFIFLSEYVHRCKDVNFVSPTFVDDLWHIQKALECE